MYCKPSELVNTPSFNKDETWLYVLGELLVPKPLKETDELSI